MWFIIFVAYLTHSIYKVRKLRMTKLGHTILVILHALSPSIFSFNTHQQHYLLNSIHLLHKVTAPMPLFQDTLNNHMRGKDHIKKENQIKEEQRRNKRIFGQFLAILHETYIFSIPISEKEQENTRSVVDVCHSTSKGTVYLFFKTS